MKTPRLFLGLAILALFSVCGCKPKPKEITSLQRKEAALLVSEAQFAISLRDYARAESGLAKAVAICPDDGEYWVNLGTMRIRLGQRDGAKTAYKHALAAFEEAAALNKKDVQPVFQQISVLVLLGRSDDARALLATLAARLPEDREVRNYLERKQLEAIMADPQFREISL